MPVNVPDTLPAIELLKAENIFIMDEERATHQDIRPLKIVVLNLMPLKVTTETDLVRLLSNTRITSYNVCYTKLLRNNIAGGHFHSNPAHDFRNFFIERTHTRFAGILLYNRFNGSLTKLHHTLFQTVIF